MKKILHTKFVIFLLLFSGFTLNVMGINPNEGGGSKAQLELKNIINELEKKFDVSITMDAELLQDESIAKSISDNSALILAKESISKALDKLVSGTTLEYKKISKDFFVISEKPFSNKGSRRSLAPQGEKEKTVRGIVLGKRDKLPIPGATVMIKGTTIGTATDLDGNFSLKVPGNTQELLISFIGMKTISVKIVDLKKTNSIVYLQEDFFGLEEIVISGVAAETPQKNLTVSVKRVSTKELEDVQSSDAISALQGRVGGLTIINGSGLPGTGSGIRLRGATSITGSNAPLIMVDGTIISMSLADLNFEDVESFEIVQGAAASALYGSKAANGVVVIKSKRGSKLADGEVKTTVKATYGFEELPRHLPLATHHPYKLDDNWDSTIYDYTRYWHVLYNSEGEKISGDRTLNNSDSSYVDQPYKKVNDFQSQVFQKGQYYSLFASVEAKQKNINYFLSYEHNKQQGIFQRTDGYTRNNFTISLDNYLTKKIKISTSNHIITTLSNEPGSIYSATSGMLKMAPDVELIDSINEDGSFAMRKYPDVWQYGVVQNPLIPLYHIDRARKKNNVFGNVNLKYDIFKYLSASIKYTYEYRFINSTTYYPLGYLGGGSNANGSYYNDTYRSFSQELQPILNFNLQEKDYFITAKLSYKYESKTYSSENAYGRGFTVADIRNFQNLDPKTIKAYSYLYKIVAINGFGITDFGYKDTYFLSALIRRDGSSLFGANQKWQTYYRLSGALRLSNFIKTDWIDELKLSSAYGVAGIRPKFSQQYETWDIYNGMMFPATQGNKDLRPPISKEWETTLNFAFLNNFSSEIVYSRSKSKDALFLVPLPSQFGYNNQWQNIGGSSSKTLAITLDALIMKSADFTWSTGLTYTTVSSKIDELGVPTFYQGPSNVFMVRDNEIYGIIYGYDWVRTMEDMAKQLPEGKTINDYEINNEGYVVPKGSQATNNELAIPIDTDNDGVRDKVIIGDGNEKFRMDMSNSFSFHNVNVGIMLSWKNGGDIYNRSRQALYRDLRAPEIDQFGKPENEKKSLYYYQNFYSNSEINSYFVEDASYLKIREFSISYHLTGDVISSFLGENSFVKGIRLSMQGRNLYTFTGYKGFDPEVAYRMSDKYFPYDNFTYPNFRTYTFSLKIQL